jgi:hypothetical protein
MQLKDLLEVIKHTIVPIVRTVLIRIISKYRSEAAKVRECATETGDDMTKKIQS